MFPRLLLLALSALTFLFAPTALSASEHRVLVLVSDGFNYIEYHGTVGPLLAAGYQVVIATADGQSAHLSPDGDSDPEGRDVVANLKLSDVGSPDTYAGLFIPGGYGASVLELNSDAVAIAAAFLDAGKPVAAICHGPRLLLRADRMHDRVWTGLWNLADQMPDIWISPRRGAYLDQSVVVDGNLLTARYPRDIEPFAQQTVVQLARLSGGPELPHPLSMIVVAPGWSRHERRFVEFGLRHLGHQVDVISEPRQFPRESTHQMQVILPAAATAAEDLNNRAWQRVATALGRNSLDPDVGYANATQASLALPLLGHAAAAQASAMTVTEESLPASAALALREGFDDAVAAGLLLHLRHLGHHVVILADQPGWIRGANGFPLHADASYANAQLTANALIIAPGGHYPELRDNTPQGGVADWLTKQAQRDQERTAWLRQRFTNGAYLVAVGMDAWYLARGWEELGTVNISGSQQLRGFYPRGGPQYSDDPISQSHQRIITVRDFQALPQAIPLLSSPPEPQP